MRGGGKHKDKKGQKERKRSVKPKGPEQEFEEEPKRDVGPATQECDKDTVIQMIEQSEENRKVMVQMISEGSDTEMEQEMQNYRTACREVLGWSQEQAEMMERGLRWAVEAKRKGRETQTELTEGQEHHEEVRFREEEQSEVVNSDSLSTMTRHSHQSWSCVVSVLIIRQRRTMHELFKKGSAAFFDTVLIFHHTFSYS